MFTGACRMYASGIVPYAADVDDQTSVKSHHLGLLLLHKAKRYFYRFKLAPLQTLAE